MKRCLLTVDVAHPPRHPDVVETELDRAADLVRSSASYRVMKIVHGYGSSGRGGSTREVARNWAYRRRRGFRSVIEGETYALDDAATCELRLTVGAYADPDLGAGNRGITIVWVK